MEWHHNLPTSPVKTSPLKVQQKRSSVSSNSNVVQSSTKKGVPPNFKVSTLLMSIKKSVSLDSDAERKSKKLEGMRIDATSVDSIKNVKDRSSVGHFHKEFDDSKIMLEDYINTLRHNVQEKQKILPLLNSSEAFYALAQDEAKVIVNAYKTFGNRLNSMKRKLDVKISKLEDDASRTPEEQTDSRGHKMRSSSGGSIQDMDLDSESEEEDVPSSQAYNPSTAPSHEDLAQQGSTPSFLPTNGGMTSFLDSSASAQLLLQQQPMMMSTDIAAIATQQQAVQPDVFQQQQQQDSEDQQNTAVKTLIDSLFPVLSKSLQTIKEKTNVGDEKPSVNAAMAFALGDVVNMVQQDEAMADPSKAISPVSLTNPNGLSDHQTELINIAAGVTELDANCQPLSRAQSVDEEKMEKKEKHEEDVERKRDDRKSTSSGRHRHRSHRSDDNRHRRSSSRSPQRRSSHRSSRDDRRDKDRDRGDRRRSSRRSPSPRRRSSKGSRRRSSSRERGEKRKHSSAEEREKPYYNNNRRSPTPEMDATSNTTSATNNPVAATTSPQFLQQNQNQTPQQPIPNDQPQSQPNAKPMMISSFQPVDPNVAQQPAPSIQQRLQQVEEPPQQNLVPSNNTPVAPTFHATNQQQQSTDDNMEQSDDDSQTPTPTIQLAPTQPFPFPNPFENMVPTLNPIMQPPPMNFPPTPMQQAAMNLVRVQNPLQLLQQDTENMPQPPPFVPPPFFAPPQQLPVPPMQPDMNLPTNEQNNLPFNPQQKHFLILQIT
ncbi:serine/arginine repetitive matrix protein 1-like [Clytia hemisphaerica]|uniref:Uncharacterized protein n=1 Tax=Clytia hemisphaerica TaxID=252671 RepID=A0A7M5WTP5_9CNID